MVARPSRPAFCRAAQAIFRSAYARERRFGLEVYLTDPDVPIDTNHLERAILTGRKYWMFCWTELGAKHVGIMRSLT
jgi:transposase